MAYNCTLRTLYNCTTRDVAVSTLTHCYAYLSSSFGLVIHSHTLWAGLACLSHTPSTPAGGMDTSATHLSTSSTAAQGAAGGTGAAAIKNASVTPQEPTARHGMCRLHGRRARECRECGWRCKHKIRQYHRCPECKRETHSENDCNAIMTCRHDKAIGNLCASCPEGRAAHTCQHGIKIPKECQDCPLVSTVRAAILAESTRNDKRFDEDGFSHKRLAVHACPKCGRYTRRECVCNDEKPGKRKRAEFLPPSFGGAAGVGTAAGKVCYICSDGLCPLGLSCAHRHFICQECLRNQIIFVTDTKSDDSVAPVLKCMHKDCCSEEYAFADLISVVGHEPFQRLLDCKMRAAEEVGRRNGVQEAKAELKKVSKIYCCPLTGVVFSFWL